MSEEFVQIEIYDKRRGTSTIEYVEQISESKFRMIDNSAWKCSLTLGTKFETRLNKEGKHEIKRR